LRKDIDYALCENRKYGSEFNVNDKVSDFSSFSGYQATKGSG
jgi:hypothetical protein